MNELTIKYTYSYVIGGRTMTKTIEIVNPHLCDMDKAETAIAGLRRAIEPHNPPDQRVPYRSGDWLKWFASEEQLKAKVDS